MKITRSARWAGTTVLGTFMFLAALLPATHAQIVPVSLAKTTIADSKIPSGTVLVPLPHSELRRALKPALPKSYWVLTAGVYTAAGLDMQQSESMLPHFDEKDPIVRPFLRLPAPVYYASAALFSTGMNFLGWKMRARSAGTKSGGCRRSRPWRETWRDTDTRERIRGRIDSGC